MLAISLLLARLIAVDVAGMEPQIEIITAHAAKNGWSITCTGRSGEFQTIRLQFPKRTKQKQVESLFERYATTTRYYLSGATVPRSCDDVELPVPLPPESPAGTQTLAVGRPEILREVHLLARRCGFTEATIREYRPGDLLGDNVAEEGWQTLDAGEDIGRRGPLMCLMQVSEHWNSPNVRYREP